MIHPLVTNLKVIETDKLLETLNSLYQKQTMILKSGNTNALAQLKLILSEYQNEYNLRMAEEAEKAKQNPIMKNSVDIG